MYFSHVSPKTKGKLIFLDQEISADRFYRHNAENEYVLSIVMNGAETQQMTIDGVTHEFAPYSIIPLLIKQVFSFEKPELVTCWQYTRDFYCLADNYFEISCLGILFFGYSGNLFLTVNEEYQKKFQSLRQVFIEEFNTVDTIQTDMLQMLLKRLIILITRLAKEQYLSGAVYTDEKFDLIRRFNLLVAENYKQEHQVSYYAELLNKSPKTLTRIFTGFNYSTPSVLIQDRIIMEAKRLFCYTKLSVKEIAYDLGFSDAGHFSRFFKNATDQNPSDFRKQQ